MGYSNPYISNSFVSGIILAGGLYQLAEKNGFQGILESRFFSNINSGLFAHIVQDSGSGRFLHGAGWIVAALDGAKRDGS